MYNTGVDQPFYEMGGGGGWVIVGWCGSLSVVRTCYTENCEDVKCKTRHLDCICGTFSVSLGGG